MNLKENNINVCNDTSQKIKNNINGKKVKWNSKSQSLLIIIGFTVGLGNIWRLSALLYENGSGILLIPYIILSIFLGVPLLFMEFYIGQSTSLGPLNFFSRIVPIFQGIGWGMICISIFMTIYYISLVSWIFLYILKIVIGKFNSIVSCKNNWNSIYCISTFDDELCKNGTKNNYVYFNNSCYIVPHYMNDSEFRNELFNNVNMNTSLLTYATEEYFYKNILSYDGNFYNNIFAPNLEILISYNIIYILAFLIVLKGIKFIGRVALITSTIPYLIILLFFSYSLKLEGSWEGIKYFLYEKIDFFTIFKLKIWRLASEQLFLSLSCGIGVTLFLSSHNERNQNIFKNSIIVVSASNFISICSSITTFSILGFMAKKLGKGIEEVVNNGKVLGFVIYPEVTVLTSTPSLFCFFFFLSLLFLGLICIVCLITSITTSIIERYSKFKNFKNIVLYLFIMLLYIIGIPVTTKAGIYYFEMLNTFVISFNIILIGAIECIAITHFYGIRNYNNDIEKVLGKNKSMFLKIFGSSGYAMTFFQMFLCPVAMLGLVIICIKESSEQIYIYGNKQYQIILPKELIYFGWFVCLLPLFLILLGILMKIWQKRHMNIREIVRPNEKNFILYGQYKPSYLITFIESSARCWRKKKCNGRISVFRDDKVFSKS